MSTLDLSSAHFLFRTTGHDDGELRVFSFSGREEMSRPFHFQIALIADKPDIELESLIGEPALLTLHGQGGDALTAYTRHVHGVIERFEQVSMGPKKSRYEAVLVPTILPLRYTRNNRIFQQMTVPDIVEKVLKDGGIPGDGLKKLLQGSYGKRDYCVQYQESDLDFIQRLLEEEGIFYRFEHTEDKDVFVLGDGAHAVDPVPHVAELNYRDSPHLYEEVVHDFRATSALRPGGTVMRDFRFKQPSLDLEAKHEADKFGKYSMYYFPGEYVEPGLGKRLAKVRLEEQQTERVRFEGVTTTRAFLPGYKFKLKRHGRDDFNQDYLLVAVEHEGTQPQVLAEEQVAGDGANQTYRCRLWSIPAKVPFRPQRVTPRPNIPGVQSAVVVGPSGEEIYCDEFGRVKVQFHWDREGKKDDKSSCWIRVSQPWGGGAFGGMFIPRIGQEVLIQFIEGDPDRPVVVGRVYNGAKQVPYGLPANKTRSTIKSESSPGGGGYNEIRFEDAAGKEEIWVHGQLDMNSVIERDMTEKFGRDTTGDVGRNNKVTIGNNETYKVGVDRGDEVGSNENRKVGVNQSWTIGSNQTIHVGADQTVNIDANQSVTIGSNQTESIGANESITVGGNHTESIGSNMTINVGSCLTETVAIAYTETVGAAMTLTVGAAFTETVGAVKTSTIGAALIESVGASHSEDVGANHSLSAGGGISMQAGKAIDLSAGKEIAGKAGKEVLLEAGTKMAFVAADEIALTAGDASIVLKKNGDISIKGNNISIKGNNISIKGDGDVVIKGSKIAQN